MIFAQLTKNQVATIYFEYSAELLSNIANILGKEEDRAHYTDLTKKVKDAWGYKRI